MSTIGILYNSAELAQAAYAKSHSGNKSKGFFSEIY